MAQVKLIYDNQIHIHKLPNPQQLTFQLLHELIPKVFTKLPKKYTLHYLSNKSLTQIKEKADIEEWISKLNQQNQLCRHENITAPFKLYILQVNQLTNNKSIYKNEQEMIAEKLSQMSIQQQFKNKKLSQQNMRNTNKLQAIQQNNKNQQSQANQISIIDMNKKQQSDNNHEVQIQQMNDQDQLTYQMNKMKIVQGTYSQDQQDQVNADFSEDEENVNTNSNGDQNKNKYNIKINLTQKQKKIEKQMNQESTNHSENTTHYNVVCDNCLKKNIQGIRWKCSVCLDYDLCQKCQQSVQHEHDLIRIKKPKLKQKPKQNIIPLQNKTQSKSSKSSQYINLQFPGKNKHQKKQQKIQMYSEKQQALMENQQLWGQTVAKALQLQDLLDITYEQSLQFVKDHLQREFSELIEIYFQKKNKNVHVNE